VGESSQSFFFTDDPKPVCQVIPTPFDEFSGTLICCRHHNLLRSSAEN